MLLKLLLVFSFFVTLVKSEPARISTTNKNVSEFQIENLPYQLNYVFQQVAEAKAGSIQCQKQMKQFLQMQEWSVKMLDSSSKLQAGLFEGNVVDFGHFDECINIDHDYIDDQTKRNEKILGKYCALAMNWKLPISPTNPAVMQMIEQQMNTRAALVPSLSNALCLPNECTPDDFNNAIKNTALSNLLTIKEMYCQTKEFNTDIDGYAIFGIVFYSVFAALAITSTAYDLYIQKSNKKPAHILLVAFSVYSNGKKLIDTTPSPNQISCLNGLKVISMMWVIMGHIGASAQGFMAYNALEVMEIFKDTWSQFIQGAHLAVDTFLFMTGFLLTMSFVRAQSKPGAKFNLILFYIHRYLRLTPALLGIFVFVITLLRYTNSGPLWPAYMEYASPNCKEYFWAVFLYIQNYLDINHICLIQTWYISLDMQVFILAPIVLIPLVKWPKKGLYFLIFVLAITIIIPTVITYVYKTEMFKQDYYDYYYYLTHTRLAPYVMGMLFGYYIYKTNNKKFSIHWLLNLVIWIIVLCGMGACVFTGSDIIYNYDRVETTVYLTLLRPAWTLGLIWIVFSSMKGHGGIVNWFLSLPGFQFVARLNYSMYLWHHTILLIFARSRFPPHMTRTNMVFDFWGFFAFTTLASIISVLLFESPIIIIEKVIFGGGGGKRKAVKKEPETNGEDKKNDINDVNGKEEVKEEEKMKSDVEAAQNGHKDE